MEHSVELRREGFERIAGVTRPVAVYCLLRRGQIVYVGQTKNVFWRIAQHYVNMRRTRKLATMREITHGTVSVRVVFDEVMVRWCDKSELDSLEMRLMHRFKPEANVKYREKLPQVRVDLAQIIAKAGLQGWKKNLSDSSPVFKRRNLG